MKQLLQTLTNLIRKRRIEMRAKGIQRIRSINPRLSRRADLEQLVFNNVLLPEER